MKPRKKRPLTCQEAGRRGGYRSRLNVSPERASEIGRLAVAAREAKRKLAAKKAAGEPKGDA